MWIVQIEKAHLTLLMAAALCIPALTSAEEALEEAQVSDSTAESDDAVEDEAQSRSEARGGGMITLEPVRKAIVPVDSEAARRVSGPNYDEFQGDREIWDLLQSNPSSILRVTMAHCDAPARDELLKEGSPEALERAAANTAELVASSATRTLARSRGG